MNVDSYRHTLNDALQTFALQFKQILELLFKGIEQVYIELYLITSGCRNPIQFTSVQYCLLKLLIGLLLLTFTLIACAWKIYGQVITDKFVKPNKRTLKEIEELRKSVAKLKLPKEHSPRL